MTVDIVFEERRHIAGRYSASVVAYWCKDHQWLLLEAHAYDREDDGQLDPPDWLPRRPQPIVTQAISRFGAIRIAVDDANAWYAHVREAVNDRSHEESVSP